MTWLLTTPEATAHPTLTLPECRVTVNHDGRLQRISGTIEYGETVGDEWVSSIPPSNQSRASDYMIIGGDYLTVMGLLTPNTSPTDPGSSDYFLSDGVWVEKGYAMNKRVAYEYLSARGDIPPGTLQ